jgi:hypothetical protein
VMVASEEDNPDEDMDDPDAETEVELLQKHIENSKALGLCVIQATAKLKEITPKIATRIDLAKAGKDLAAERIRLLHNQEYSAKSLRATIAQNLAKITTVQEQQVKLVAEQTEIHNKRLEAIKRDCARSLEATNKEMMEAQDKLDLNTAIYEADYKRLDTMAALPAAMQPVQSQERAETKLPQAQEPPLPKPPTITTENMQALLGATGNNGATAEQVALLTSVMPMLNAIIASAMQTPQAITEAPVASQDEANAIKAARDKEAEEKNLAAEAEAMNEQAKSLLTVGPVKAGKTSNRADPLV